MKITLVYSNFRNTLGQMGLSRFTSSVMAPLGIAYIAAYLRTKGHEIKIIDAYAEDLTEEEVVSRIKKDIPDVIGFSMHTEIFFSAKIAELIKQSDPGIVTVAGGVIATSIPQLILEKFPMFDFIIKGEGELSFSALLQNMGDREKLSVTNGIAYRQNGRIILTPRQEYIQDLDSLPFPARDLLPNNLYGSYTRGPVALIEAARGCNGNCAFCSVEKMFGNKIRKRNPLKVIDEMEECYRRYKVDFFVFIDNTFTADKEFVCEIIKEMSKRNLHKKVNWRCATRVDCVDEAILRKMKKAGCVEIGFGVEAASQDTLNLYRKEITLKDTVNAFALAKKAGLSSIALTIVNQYCANISGAGKATVEFCKKIKADRIALQPLIIYPQTSLYNNFLSKGYIKKEADYNSFFAGKFLESEYISFNGLIKIIDRMYLDFYLNKNYLLVIIKHIRLWRFLHKIRILIKKLIFS